MLWVARFLAKSDFAHIYPWMPQKTIKFNPVSTGHLPESVIAVCIHWASAIDEDMVHIACACGWLIHRRLGARWLLHGKALKQQSSVWVSPVTWRWQDLITFHYLQLVPLYLIWNSSAVFFYNCDEWFLFSGHKASTWTAWFMHNMNHMDHGQMQVDSSCA